MLPINYNDEGTEVLPQNVGHPFKRGIMSFDDYNYKNFNRYILLEEPEGEERNRIILDRKKLDSARRGDKLESKSSLSF